MKILVTGSRGFIGKSLVKKLKENGNEVYECDRCMGSELTPDGFINTTMCNPTELDVIYHLAAQTSVFNTNHKEIEKDNISSFIYLVNFCERYDIKLVYASSSTANTSNTTSMYGISKRFNEDYARIYCKNATGVRLHNVYGPNPRQGTLLFSLLKNSHVDLYNEGQNIRCFTYIDDAVNGIIKASTMNYKLINVANVQPVTTSYFSELVSRKKDVKINLVHDKRKFDNLTQDIDRTFLLLPLSYTSVEDGIEKVFKEDER